jgi:hypothetical protein
MPNFNKKLRRPEPGPQPGKQPPWGDQADYPEWPAAGPGKPVGPVQTTNTAPHSLKDQRGLRTGTTSPNRGFREPGTQPRQEAGSPPAARPNRPVGGKDNLHAPHPVGDEGPWAQDGGSSPRGIRGRK